MTLTLEKEHGINPERMTVNEVVKVLQKHVEKGFGDEPLLIEYSASGERFYTSWVGQIS